MLEGSATLVTGGTLVDERSSGISPNTKMPNFRGSRIEGDVIIIPGRVPHWWSSPDGDIQYVIYRPDPAGLQRVQ